MFFIRLIVLNQSYQSSKKDNNLLFLDCFSCILCYFCRYKQTDKEILMINIRVEDNNFSQSFVDFARTLPYVTVEETLPRRRTMAEAVAECGGHTVDEFVNELKARIDKWED